MAVDGYPAGKKYREYYFVVCYCAVTCNKYLVPNRISGWSQNDNVQSLKSTYFHWGFSTRRHLETTTKSFPELVSNNRSAAVHVSGKSTGCIANEEWRGILEGKVEVCSITDRFLENKEL